MLSLKPTPILCLITSIFICSQVSAADIEAGKEKAASCAACHGLEGNSKNASFPILAGQKGQYIVAQLNAFASGARSNEVMQSIAEPLSKEDRINIAAYFTKASTHSAGGDKKLATAGKTKFSSCAGCHGANAEGRASFPKLAGQYPAYISKQLHDFKSGARKGGPMPAMAAGLSDQDIKEIAAYLGTLD